MLIGDLSASKRSKSVLVADLRARACAGIFDIDNTATGSVRSQLQFNEVVKSRGPLVLATARDLGMVMSSKALEASRAHGYTRAAPNLGYDQVTRRHYYVKPERMEWLAGHLNPAAIFGFGGGILWQQQDGGYAPDRDYELLLDPRFRERVRAYINDIDYHGDVVDRLSVLDDERAFEEGRANVPPLPYRFQLEFDTEASKVDIKFRFAAYQRYGVRIVDESRPLDTHFVIYAVPEYGTKQMGVEFMLRAALKEANVPPNQFRFISADDAFTGIPMLDMLPEAKGAFVLPGGAPVARHLIPASSLYGTPFAGELVVPLIKRLTRTERDGHYLCAMPDGHASRPFIIADQAVPDLVAADSLLALEQSGFLYPAA